MTHTRISSGLAEVEDMWSLDNLVDAHAFLDALEDAEARLGASSGGNQSSRAGW